MPSTNPRRNIAAMCAAMALFIVNDACVKAAAADWPTAQIMAVRGFAAALMMGVLAWSMGELAQWRMLLRPLVAGRCLLEGLIAFAYISALAVLPLADVTAILLISPLLITAAGALLLGETVRWRRWLAVGVGFAGMLLVVRPLGEGFGLVGLVAVAATVGVAARDLITRRIPAEVPTSVIAFGTTLAGLAVGLTMTPAQPWQPLAPQPLVLAVGAAALVAGGNIAIVAAFRNVDVSIVSPFRYTAIVWALLLGVFAFGERPAILSWIGIVLIVGAGLYTLYREAALARPKAEAGGEKHARDE
jgi:drug/metabolite transporter (DMT)-like permease